MVLILQMLQIESVIFMRRSKCSISTLAFEFFGGFSEVVRKTLQCIALLSDNRIFESVFL